MVIEKADTFYCETCKEKVRFIIFDNFFGVVCHKCLSRLKNRKGKHILNSYHNNVKKSFGSNNETVFITLDKIFKKILN